MRQFLLFVHTGRASAMDALHRVAEELHAAGVRPLIIKAHEEEIRQAGEDIVSPEVLRSLDQGHIGVCDVSALPSDIELCVVLGGDGTILRALEAIRGLEIPVHGVNLGHVGFLAESEAEDLVRTVQRLLKRDYVIENRSALAVRVYDDEGELVTKQWALNEASLEKADRERMIYVVVGIDGRPVSEFGCDGVLLSTSTGSTAYAFSAGGPVMWPEVDAMLLVPLAAHALFARPLVLGRSSIVDIMLTQDSPSHGILNLDGRRHVDLGPGYRIQAKLSKDSVRFARFAETPFADRLVKKFKLPVEGWRSQATRAQQEAESA